MQALSSALPCPYGYKIGPEAGDGIAGFRRDHSRRLREDKGGTPWIAEPF
jgi:hypothetical protein